MNELDPRSPEAMQIVTPWIAASANAALITSTTPAVIPTGAVSPSGSSPSAMNQLADITVGGFTPAGKSPGSGWIARSTRSTQPDSVSSEK